MAEYNSLVITVEKDRPAGKPNDWTDFSNQIKSLTRDIKTPPLNDSSDLSAVVSGMPTVFARANLFKNALQYTNDATSEDSGLLNFYGNLISEWRGIIAAIALDYTRIKVERIYLRYSDGADIINTKNVYEPKGAFGNALFDRRPLWSQQGNVPEDQNYPFVDVIYYGNETDGTQKVVGAVSPESLFFTAPGYKVTTSHSYVDARTHKFTDPTNRGMDTNDKVTLLAYVEHIMGGINKLTQYYQELPAEIRPNYTSVQEQLRRWIEELKKICSRDEIERKSVPPVNKFKEPYSKVYNYSTNYYGRDGVLWDDSDVDETEGKTLFAPKDILLPKGSQIARIVFSNEDLTKEPQQLAEQPVYVLKAEKKGRHNEYAYFALPFTPLGLNVFGKNLGALLGIDRNEDGSAIPSKLHAVYDENSKDENLEVILELSLGNGKGNAVKETYKVNPSGCVMNKDILLWPNFIAEGWNRYFLYSEMPHNVCANGFSFNATPIIGHFEENDFRIIVEEDVDAEGNQHRRPYLLAANGRINQNEKIKTNTGLDARFRVVADERISDNSYKYEVYESNLPFAGVKLSTGSKDSGYLVVRYSSTGKGFIPQNKLNQEYDLKPVQVGIDFGSTNTAVAYSLNGEPHSITLNNHVVSLLQSETKEQRMSRGLQEKDLFFFQSREVEGNAIKSILTLTDPKRLDSKDNASCKNEISGGMPCFASGELLVESIDPYRIHAKCGRIGDVSLVYNMKWTDSQQDQYNKEAFLRSLMLHVYAQLYEEGYVPTLLKWSYPSAMNENLVTSYSSIWKALAERLSPVCNKNNRSQQIELKICSDDIGNRGFIDIAGFGGAITSQFGALGETNNPFGGIVSNPFSGNALGVTPAASTADIHTGGAFGGGTFGTFGGESFGMFGGSATPGVAKNSADGNEDLTIDPDIIDLKDFDVVNKIKVNNNVTSQSKEEENATCLTEACAVANYAVKHEQVANGSNTLTLVFDVGGSTTDISALIEVQGKKYMVKQNSIRFAAQRITNAAGHEPKLRDVLLETCNNNNIRIPGLNWGPNMYSSQTASFFFDQVLDKVNENQLQALYKKLSSVCNKLMTANLYVTGLIVYYSGQIANKLINVVRRSNIPMPNVANFMPIVNLMFTGKGSRVYDWFRSNYAQSAGDYYSHLFYSGLTGMLPCPEMFNKVVTLIAHPNQYGQNPRFVFSADPINGHSDVKYEVAKGLTILPLPSRELYKLKKNAKAIEILGEDNFYINRRSTNEMIPLPFDSSITPEMLKRVGFDFIQQPPQQGQFACTKFINFVLLFRAAVQQYNQAFTDAVLAQGFTNLDVNSIVVDLPEYKRAMNSPQFDFVAPIIILEGMRFYEKCLLPCL